MLDITQYSNILLPLASLITGTIGSWILLKPKINQRDEYIEELEDSIKNHAEQLQNRDITLTNHQTSQKTFNKELSQRENTINKMKARIDELSVRLKELISEKNNHLATLTDALKHKEQDTLELSKHAHDLESTEKNMRLELSQRVEAFIKLQNELQERSDYANSLKEDLAENEKRIQSIINNRDRRIDQLSLNLDNNNETINNLTERIGEKEEYIQNLNAQLIQRDEITQRQDDQLHEQRNYLKNLSEKNVDLQEQNQKIITRAEDAKTREIELGTALKTKDLEYATLQNRTRRMHDDFTHITGIGQKISSTLINAGIKTFSKLATTDGERIREILEKENPALMKISDPTTWPEQARIAAEGDWETLSNLQSSLKASKI
jgi:predicted flap endonuclease-1-like 5' DNA nuclease